MEKQSTELTTLHSRIHAQQAFLQMPAEDRKEYKLVAASSWVGSPQPRACPARPQPLYKGKETGFSLTGSLEGNAPALGPSCLAVTLEKQKRHLPGVMCRQRRDADGAVTVRGCS